MGAGARTKGKSMQRMYTRAPLARRLLVMAFAFAGVTGVVQAQTIQTIAGNGSDISSGNGGPATAAGFSWPTGVAVDADGNRYVAEFSGYRIRKIDPNGVVATVAGTGQPGYGGDNGPATSASIKGVFDLAVDAAGNLYIADYYNDRVRKLTPAGVITTVAGNGVKASGGDGGPAVSASIHGPIGVTFDAAGNLYVAEYGGHRVRKVTPGGTISTVAGNGINGFGGDGGPATSAAVGRPLDVAVDGAGALYISGEFSPRVRRVGADGTITTVAGNGTVGYSGDGGAATAASLTRPWHLAVGGGTLYIADWSDARVRAVSNGTIRTFAGTGLSGFSGDGGPAASAKISIPAGLALDGVGDLYIADQSNARVRKVTMFTSCAAEGYGGGKLALCRQICEVPQSSTSLAGLLKAWMAAYRSEPPCAR